MIFDHPDPLAKIRQSLIAHAGLVARYADIVIQLSEIRDDAGATMMRRRLIDEVNAMSGADKLLQSQKAQLPDEAALQYQTTQPVTARADPQPGGVSHTNQPGGVSHTNQPGGVSHTNQPGGVSHINNPAGGRPNNPAGARPASQPSHPAPARAEALEGASA